MPPIPASHPTEHREPIPNRRYDPSQQYGWSLDADDMEYHRPRHFVHELCPASVVYDTHPQQHSDVVIVGVHGVSYKYGNHLPTACGVYFGAGHYLNRGFQIETTEYCEQRTAELLAAIEALRAFMGVAKEGYSYPLPVDVEEMQGVIELDMEAELMSQKRYDIESIGNQIELVRKQRKIEKEDRERRRHIKAETLVYDDLPSLAEIPAKQEDIKVDFSDAGKASVVLEDEKPKLVDVDDKATTAKLDELPKKQKVRRLIVKTESDYLVHSMTRYLYQYQMNGWTNLKGNPVRRRALLRELDKLISSMEDSGVEVLFWLVSPRKNEDAAVLADRAFDDDKFAEVRLE